ncbi:hypothetical protein GCM10027340_23590 [Marinomonas epiphytica]
MGLSPSHAYLLIAIGDNPSASQKDLREQLELDASTVTRFIDALVTKGHLERNGAGKGSSFSITSQGQEVLVQLRQVAAKLKNKMQGKLGEQGFADAVGYIKSIKQSID